MNLRDIRKKTNKIVKRLSNLDSLINYLQKTKKEDWMLGVCASKNWKKRCLLGHIFYWGWGDDWSWSETIDIFEDMRATTYMFYPVNDWQHPKYKQKHAKDRCIQYLKDLQLWKRKTTQQLCEDQVKFF